MAGRVVEVETDAELFSTIIDSGDFGYSEESGTVRLGKSGIAGGLALGDSAGVTTFTALTQTPNTLGSDGQILEMVGGAMTWVDQGPGGGAVVSTDLTDMPNTEASENAFMRMGASSEWEYVFLRLHEVLDVIGTAGSATEGQVLARDATANLWEPRTVLGLPTIGSQGEMLRVNGGVPAYSDLSLGELSNVTLTGAVEDDILQLNDSGQWVNVNLPGSLTDTYVVSGSFVPATGVLQLTNNAGVPGSFTVDLTQGFADLGNIDDTDRGVGSFYYYDGTNLKAVAAPSLNQALKWSGSAWVYEDVLIVEPNFEPDDTTAGALYAPGTILVGNDGGDSFNPLPRGSANQVLTTAGGNLRWNDLPVYQYADRASAVDADWSEAIFPCVLVISLDQLTTIAALSAIPQAWILLAAPTAPATTASEIPIGPRLLDENGKWANDLEPFPVATHNNANILSRNAHNAMVASNVNQTQNTAFQQWMPAQKVLGSVIIPTGEIGVDTTSTSLILANIPGQITRWKIQVVGGDAEGKATGAVDAKLQYVSRNANVSAIADLTNEMTISSGSSDVAQEGLQRFLTGYVSTDGLITEGDRIYVRFGTNADSTYALQVTVYGYDLSPATTRVVVV